MEMLIIHCVIGVEGGVFSVVKNLIYEQKKAGMKTALIYIFGSINEKDDHLVGTEIIRFKKKNLLMLTGMDVYQEYHKLEKKYPNTKLILHMHNPVTVGLFNSIYDLPFICTLHGINSGNYISKLLTSFILKKMKKLKKTIIGVSNQTSNYYNKIIRESDYIKTIHNGTYIKKGDNYLNKQRNERFSIGYVSYLDSFKGWNYLVEAYGLLPNKLRGQVKLHLIGNISEKEKKKLEIVLHQYEMDEVEYYGPVFSASTHVTPYLDVLVLPSQWEGIPMCILESMGNGVPVLATKVGGIPEILINGVNGFFIKRNAKDIASKLLELIENKSMYQCLAKNSREVFLQGFTSEIMAYNYYQYYKTMSRG